MTEFDEVVLFKDIDTSIDDGINHINKVVTKLQNNDLKRLFDDLDSLRCFVHEFEFWLQEKVRNQIEIEAEQKVKAMVEAGISFNSVTVNKVRFLINGAGEIMKQRQNEDSIPF
jgi:hypothetical protein